MDCLGCRGSRNHRRCSRVRGSDAEDKGTCELIASDSVLRKSETRAPLLKRDVLKGITWVATPVYDIKAGISSAFTHPKFGLFVKHGVNWRIYTDLGASHGKV